MQAFKTILKKFFILIFLFSFLNSAVNSEEEEGDSTFIKSIMEEVRMISQDLKTLEKAVYNSSDITPKKTGSSSNLDEDVLTKHLLKLNEIEEQFRELTNRFEEINFKMDKLSNRVTKIQSDNQIRFSDLESNSTEGKGKNDSIQKKVNLPGTDKAQDFGSAPGYSTANLPETQQTQSIESAGTVITEQAEQSKSLLPNKPASEQYEFAVSFMKIGDYETAEFALREFIDKNKDHDLAGNAQYWYGETFRIRQLYSDAATAYLDGYQNYPKSKKAPDNLLKLGITMVQLGEKDQGCSMINGVKKQYPKASKSVLQKAQYEQKKFKCEKS